MICRVCFSKNYGNDRLFFWSLYTGGDPNFEETGEPQTKRKKTVTWADDDAMDVDIQEREVAEILMSDDALFKELDIQGALDLAAQHQHPTPDLVSSADLTNDNLTLSQLRERRLQRLAYLEEIYTAEVWAVADEMLLQRWVANLDNLEDSERQPDSHQASCTSDSDFGNVSRNDVLTKIVEGGVRAAWLAISEKEVSNRTIDPTMVENLYEFVTNTLPLADNKEQVHTFQQHVVKRREAFVRKLTVLRRLEQSATAALARELDGAHAVAALCTKNSRYLLRKTAVTVGCLSGANAANGQGIDVNLSEEGPVAAGLPSRQFAQIFINADGAWSIKVVGRQKISLNGTLLENEKTHPLPHMSLLVIGPISLLFVINTNASQRIAKASDIIHV